MKKVVLSVLTLLTVLFLAACWPAEVSVETTIKADGSGTRVFVIDIMDDTLSTTPITNPDDPEGDEEKGAVINDKHIKGGLLEIQTWLKENAPDFITVHEPTVDGYHRYFKMSFDFKDFEEFIDKYRQLVNLSPSMKWEDFDVSELPKFTATGSGSTKELTFSESKVLVEASLDWAVSGIYADIYEAADLAGYVTQSDIWVLASVTINLGDGKFEELRHYDEDAVEADGKTGKVVFVESEMFNVKGTGSVTNTLLVVLGVVLGVAVVGGVVAFFVLKKKQ